MRIVFILVFFVFLLSSNAKDINEIENTNKELISKAFDEWVKGTGGLFSLLSDDAMWTVKGRNHEVSKTFNKKELIKEVIVPFNSKLKTPLVPVLNKIYADGDTVLLYFDASATTKKGYKYKNSYLWILNMKDKKIYEVIAFLDMVEFEKLWSE